MKNCSGVDDDFPFTLYACKHGLRKFYRQPSTCNALSVTKLKQKRPPSDHHRALRAKPVQKILREKTDQGKEEEREFTQLNIPAFFSNFFSISMSESPSSTPKSKSQKVLIIDS